MTINKLLLITVCLFGLAPALKAQGNIADMKSNLAAMGNAPQDVLSEKDDIKKLIIKYDLAPQVQKPAIKKDIEKLQLKKEEQSIERAKLRLKRQETKLKEVKERTELRIKNKSKTAAERTQYLTSQDSIKKIKEESINKKVVDTIKNKR